MRPSRMAELLEAATSRKTTAVQLNIVVKSAEMTFARTDVKREKVICLII